MASASQLTAIPLFESLSGSDLDELARWFDVQIAGEGVRLIGEGSSGYSFFILTQGSAAVFGGCSRRTLRSPGESRKPCGSAFPSGPERNNLRATATYDPHDR